MRQACIVPGCASNARTPAHIFPKNINQRLLWLKKLKIENIEHVISLARCKLRVCYKHFSDDDYIYSVNRRKLKDNAVPCLNIPSRIKCIAASNNIDSQQALISDCNLEFCPDIIALEPLQSAHENQDIRYATYIQERNMNCNRSNEVMNSNEVIEETVLSNAIIEHVQHTEGETRDEVINFAYERHERQDEVLATSSRRQQESNVRLFKRRTLLLDCRRHDAQLRNAILSTIITTCLKKFCTAVNRRLNGKYTSTMKNPVLISAQMKYRSRIKKRREQKSVQQNGDAVQK